MPYIHPEIECRRAANDPSIVRGGRVGRYVQRCAGALLLCGVFQFQAQAGDAVGDLVPESPRWSPSGKRVLFWDVRGYSVWNVAEQRIDSQQDGCTYMAWANSQDDLLVGSRAGGNNSPFTLSQLSPQGNILRFAETDLATVSHFADRWNQQLYFASLVPGPRSRSHPRHGGTFRWSLDSEPTHLPDAVERLLPCKTGNGFEDKEYHPTRPLLAWLDLDHVIHMLQVGEPLTERGRLALDSRALADFGWTQNGERLAYTVPVTVAAANAARLRVATVDADLTDVQVSPHLLPTDTVFVEFNPRGSIAAVQSERAPTLTLVNWATGWERSRPLTFSTSDVYGFAWSPDGSRLAVSTPEGHVILQFDTSDWDRPPGVSGYARSAQNGNTWIEQVRMAVGAE